MQPRITAPAETDQLSTVSCSHTSLHRQRQIKRAQSHVATHHCTGRDRSNEHSLM